MGRVLQFVWPVIAIFVKMVSQEIWDKYETKRRVRKLMQAAKVDPDNIEKTIDDCKAVATKKKLPPNPYAR